MATSSSLPTVTTVVVDEDGREVHVTGPLGPPLPQVERQRSGRWTTEEDSALRAGVAHFGARNWRAISAEFLGNGRSDVQCLHRWQKVLRPGLVKGPWTEEEDRIILECINAGITKWSEIAERIPGRIGKQCRERFFNHLDPGVSKVRGHKGTRGE